MIQAIEAAVLRRDGSVRLASSTSSEVPAADTPMSLPTALAQSCDTYFYKLGFGVMTVVALVLLILLLRNQAVLR